ncbi:MAG: NAD+ synthase [Candidatus Berkiellales bacterium]
MMQIALAQLNYKLGDIFGNFEKISKVIEQRPADLIIFSELSLTGYYPKDLISQEGFVDIQNHYLEKVAELTAKYQLAVVLGYIGKNEGKGKPYHNSLSLISHGQRLYTYHKRLLPVYNIFDEARHFSPGKGNGFYPFQDLKCGFLICEDGWAGHDEFLYDDDPVTPLVSQKCDLIICINGSPSNVGKMEERLKYFSAIAKRTQCPLAFVNQVGGNDDIVFDGTSFLLDQQGEVLGALGAFKEEVGTFTLDKKHCELSPHFQPYQPLHDTSLFYQQIILGCQDYVAKCGFKNVVIGISGGIDSTLTLALAVKALGNENVTGIAMPSRYSSSQSLEDAKKLCDTFQVKLFTASIEPEFAFALTQFEQFYREVPSSITSQNIQARLRGRFLMEYSNQTGALVLSTGNKSELSVGYTTLYGDMTGGFNLIGDLYKTDVYKLANYFNHLYPHTPIPQVIIERVPSAELAYNQKDSDTLPEYAVLDPILKLYLEGDLLPEKEIQTYQAFLATLSPVIISKVKKMVNAAEFKRRQSAPIIRVQRRAFGIGRQLPIAATYPSL